MDDMNMINWADISARLRAPFDPANVDFRVQGKAGANGKAQVVAYIDARCVQDRLDEVVGAGAWAFDWVPLIIEQGDVQVAKGTLTIHGIAKSDAGTASNFEASLGAVSHCFKRAAVLWGIGRYLYDLPATWVAIEGNGRIPAQVLNELRAKLPRPDGAQNTAPARATATPAPRAAAQRATATPTPERQPAASQSDATRPTATRAAQARVSAPPVNPSEWTTSDGYDPLSDPAMKRRVHPLGVNNMADYEAFLTRARAAYKVYDTAALEAFVSTEEARHAAVVAKVSNASAASAAASTPTARKGA